MYSKCINSSLTYWKKNKISRCGGNTMRNAEIKITIGGAFNVVYEKILKTEH